MRRRDQRSVDWLGTPKRELRIPESRIPEGSTSYKTIEGDMLDYIAYRSYRTHSKWYLIADANEFTDPFVPIAGGSRLIIPKV